MSVSIMQTIDLTGASYSAALMGMIASTALLLMGTGWIKPGWKLPVALCSIATLVGVLTLFEARNVWLATSQMPLVYRYAGWIISIPVQVASLFFLARQMGQVPIALFWRFVVISVLMIGVRYLGEAHFMLAPLAFLIGIAFWLYILGELYFGRMDEVVSQSANQNVQRGYFWLRLIVTVGWAIYPLGNFITSFGGYVDNGGLSMTYNLAEFMNSMAFGLAMLAIAIMASRDDIK